MVGEFSPNGSSRRDEMVGYLFPHTCGNGARSRYWRFQHLLEITTLSWK